MCMDTGKIPLLCKSVAVWEEGAVGQWHPLPFTARGTKRQLIFDPQIISPLNLSWPWKARLMRASDSSAISGASPSRRCWSVKHRVDLPRQAFASHAAQKWHPPLLSGYSVYNLPIFFPVSPPRHTPILPLGNCSWYEKERWMMLFWTVTRLRASQSIIIHK